MQDPFRERAGAEWGADGTSPARPGVRPYASTSTARTGAASAPSILSGSATSR